MKIGITCFIIVIIFAIGNAFIEDENPVKFYVPSNFPAPVYNFKNNPPTQAGFELGRKLFYDTILSVDNSISCENCHQSMVAFSNVDHAVSHGINGCLGTRNAPALFNLAWQTNFMWDGGVNHIENSPLIALTSSCEMGNDLNTIVKRLQHNPEYVRRFNQVFGSKTINSQRFLKALTQFLAMLISANSKYDRHIRHEPGGEFNVWQEAGYTLFKKHCNSCHTEPLFTDLSYRNNGLDSISNDPGRDTITKDAKDYGKFKVPSLRNIAKTAPYMHDGRIPTLQKVMRHYTQGVKNNPNLDPLLKQDPNHLGFNLTEREVKQITSFLYTLTDDEFLKDKRFQNSNGPGPHPY